MRLAAANATAGASAFRLTEATPDAADAPVLAVTVADLLDRFGGGRALLVKLDIEGGEAALFRSNTAWLADIEMLVIELHDWLYPWAGTSRAFFRAVSAHPFDYLMRGENLFCFRDPDAATSAP